ncbi:MAG: hypothetical protein II969_08985 [Anaerolineaceae bacterium]|nr:hypothetical protein [Anaerolineaceae bacterium]
MNPKEKAANKQAFRQMSPAEKLDYIRTYYWGPILLGVIALVILITSLHRHFTKKDQILYTALLNVVIGDELEKTLHEDYLLSRQINPQKNEILFYRNLYLSNDPSAQNHEMAYASKLKMFAVINGKKLDFALMNKEAYDILSQSDYLLDLTELSGQDEDLFRNLKPYLTENSVIIEDNAIEYNLSEADTYQAVTKEKLNGIDLSGISIFRDACFPETVYMGIIANTPRIQECCEYLEYILSTDQRRP